MKFFAALLKKMPLLQQTRNQQCCTTSKPKHLICFKNWTTSMIWDVLGSALNLKSCIRDTHGKRLNLLADYKVMILQEVNEPFLNMAVSKAATLLGAYDVNIIDHLAWEHDYMGRLNTYFFVLVVNMPMNYHSVEKLTFISSTWSNDKLSRYNTSVHDNTEFGNERYALCRRLGHMEKKFGFGHPAFSLVEQFGSLKGLNLAYFGSPHPVLNSYLLLCPMLGINIKFMCCCQKTPVSPLLYKASEELSEESHTHLLACSKRDQVLQDAGVVIAGPANPKKVEEFKLSFEDIESQTNSQWIFFHTGPRGEEVEDKLFFSQNSKTFVAFENFQYIAAALMANVIKDYKF